MPYVRCTVCDINSYVAAAWSYPARCPVCDAPLDQPRDLLLEERVRTALYPGPRSVERISRK